MRHFALAAALGLALPLAAAAQTDPFLEAGVPAATRLWSGPDYQRAAEILTAGKVPLPKFADPQGAALLRRATSLDNLALLGDKSLPLTARMDEFIQLQQGAVGLLKLYLVASDAGGYRQELAGLTALLLHSSARGAELVEEMLPTLPKDETYASRMEGLKEMKEGMTTAFVGTEQMLTPENNFSPEDLSLLLEAMAQTLPHLKTGFPPEVRIEMRKKLEDDKARFKKDEDTRRLDRMLSELGKA
jgi:hypothetical protein